MGNSTLPLGGGDARRITEVIIQPGHTFDIGDVVRVDESTPGEYVLAQADTSANAEAVGIIEDVAGDSFTIVYQGRMFLEKPVGQALHANWADTTAFAAGQVWFLSAINAGELTTTPPNTAGTVIKAMLVISDENNDESIVTGYVGVQIGGENTVTLGDIQPVGVIQPWAASATTPVPTGWALCDGQELPRQEGSPLVNTPLFDLIGTNYGNGNGSTTFNVPDLRGRFAIGQEPSGDPRFDDVAETGGETDHILTVAELPDHEIVLGVNLVAFTSGVNQALTPLGLGNAGNIAQGFTPAIPPPAGLNPPPATGVPHNTLPPFLTINFIIRVTEQASAGLLDHDLSDHTDVDDVSSPNDCDILKFNLGTGLWEAAPAPTGGGGSGVREFKNAVINGQFDFWQRGTSFGPAALLDLYTADRWSTNANAGISGATFTQSVNQVLFAPGQTDVPDNPTFHATFSGTSVGGNGLEVTGFDQRIENVRSFSNSTATLSFFAKGSTSGTIRVNLIQFFGVGGSASVFIGDEAVALTTTFQKFSLTFNVPSILGKTIGGIDSFLGIRFVTEAGASNVQNFTPFQFTGTVSLANVQFEDGSVATTFGKRTEAIELALCQRYFAKSYNLTVVPGTGALLVPERQGEITFTGTSANGEAVNVRFPQTMRANPTFSIFGIGGLAGIPNSAPAVAPEDFNFPAVLTIGESGATVVPSAAILSGVGSEFGFHYVADAEL